MHTFYCGKSMVTKNWLVWLVWRLAGVIAVMMLCLAGASGARAQGCAGVAASVTGTVTWTPVWCQEFNATVAGPPDASVWTYDLGEQRIRQQ
jgi:hypothetical protein